MENNNIGFLFDLDGVLIDSESEYTRIWEKIDRRYPTGIENFALKIKGQTLPEILGRNFSPDLHADVTAMLNDMEQKMRYNYLPGAREMLSELQRLGIGAILVTSSNEMKMKHLREELPELEGYFRDIVTADRISNSKPDPEGYLLGADILEADPRCCVVFEDSIQGLKAGKGAGAFVIGLSTTNPKETIERYCDMVVNDLSEIDIHKIIEILRPPFK